jgi:parafibromin
VLKLFSEKVLKPMQVTSKPPSSHAPVASSAPSTAASRRPDASKAPAPVPAAAQSGHRGEGATPASSGPGVRNYPIIVVPSALTSCITMINAEDFLVNGAYHTVEEKRKEGAQKQRELYLPRAMPNGGHVVYRVIDDPTKLKDGEWDHVVAVFATGQAWQFKGWKYSTPVTLFQNVLGVHVCIDSAAVDLNVQSWNCKVLKVRHWDILALLFFL